MYYKKYKKLFILSFLLLSTHPMISYLFNDSTGPGQRLFHRFQKDMESNDDKGSRISNSNSNSTSGGGKKRILFWTGYFSTEKSLKGWGIDISQINKMFKQNGATCEISLDKNVQESYDALVYMPFFDFFPRYPSRDSRHQNQIWIFLWLESPFYTYTNLKHLAGNFNWTATYRRDSDIYFPYGRFMPRVKSDKPISKPSIDSISKRKMGIWMASDCDVFSDRKAFVEELQKYISIDIYGSCGPYQCDRKQNCYKKLSQLYRFWLSFENSLCQDYVTEKFYRPLKYGSIPITYGGGNYSQIAPNHSYINALDFSSAKSLANYLLRLTAYPELYMEYFDWKDQWVVQEEAQVFEQNWLNLCHKLNDRNVKKKTYFYNDIEKWWTTIPTTAPANGSLMGSNSNNHNHHTTRRSSSSRTSACVNKKPGKINYLQKILTFLS